MILYFSATGNSEFIAKELAKRLNDDCLNLLSKIRNKDYSPIQSLKPFIIVSPVYVCEMPRFLSNYLKKAYLIGSNEVYFIFTSGGYSGISESLAKKLIKRKGKKYLGSRELKMPSNYIASNMYGEIDDKEIKSRILDSYKKLDEIVKTINERKKLKSRYIWLFEKLIVIPFNPLWYRFKQPTKPFRVTSKCIGCGKCQKVCPLNKIKLVNKKPVWEKDGCAHCMGCIQNCPMNAIEYGDITKLKKRYLFDKYRSVIQD